MPSWKNEIRISINSLNFPDLEVAGLFLNDDYLSYQELSDSKFVYAKGRFLTAVNFCRGYLQGQSEYLVKTSGSTGPPKTISLSRHQLKTSAQMTIDALALKPGYKSLVCISTDHIGGKMMLVRGMELGMDLYLVAPSSHINIKSLPGIDFVALVPLQVQALIQSDHGRDFMSSCRSIIIGGVTVEESLLKNLEQFRCPIYHTFGMTETASHFALRRLNGPEKQQTYHALEGIELSTDDRGCLIVSGEITNNKPLITNDLIQLTNSNTFRWLGRWDRVVNTGGYKVHPETLQPTIQRIFNSINLDADFVVLGLEHSRWGQQVTLVLETEPLSKDLESQIINMLNKELHPYQLPKEFRYLRVFPKTSSGKLDLTKVNQLLAR